jgi:hypothetical protein
MDATIGMSTAKAIIFSIESANSRMTLDATIAAIILAKSQGKRLLTV